MCISDRAVIGYSPEAEEEVNFLSEVASEVLYFPVYRDEPKVSESVKVVRQIPQAILNKEAAEEAFSLAQADPAKSSAKDLASGEALSAAGEAVPYTHLGIVGMETAFPVLYTHLVAKGKLTLQELVRLLDTNPRKRFGLPVNRQDVYKRQVMKKKLLCAAMIMIMVLGTLVTVSYTHLKASISSTPPSITRLIPIFAKP